jgi:hypothetical protein
MDGYLNNPSFVGGTLHAVFFSFFINFGCTT